MKLLYDIGADAPTGRGTRVFEVKDKDKAVRVIKDCWVEERPGKLMEHDIVARIKKDMGNKNFRAWFVDICGYRKTEMTGGFSKVCEILKDRTIDRSGVTLHKLLPPVPNMSINRSTPGPTATQELVCKPTKTTPAPEYLPHPRFRYQVVYEEKGKSLYEVTEFDLVFWYIGRVAAGM